ncbi:MAG: S-methyl-5-thioribose-1-phosphate isomerase [Candidatus Xenobium sp.]|jgi:methylthioribose-1-phosphate isomerase|nr:S-methyl-5-thioribose-1-phosphate isomerase [Burkholderiales bacterium]
MRPILWCDDHVEMIDQTALPVRVVWLKSRTSREVAEAIRSMKIRGAPAIGIAAAYGVALAALGSAATEASDLRRELEEASEFLAATRPTAVNLFWALQRMKATWERQTDVAGMRRALVEEARALAAEDEQMCRDIGRHGASLVPQDARILTHCNAGALATGDYGTALGVVRAAHEAGKVRLVWVDETRPFLQGARLTAWELMQDGIPCRLICDNMAGHFMQRGQVDMVVVGADRITAHGDVANKIGTYSVAVLCREHGIPFYVAAPYSTIDPELVEGSEIPIEERSGDEMTEIAGHRIAPEGVPVANPAFDVTPARLVSAIITEKGVFRPPYPESLSHALKTVGRPG